LEDATDVSSGSRVDFDNAPAVHSQISIAVRSFSRKPALLHSPVDTLADIDRHLFRKKQERMPRL
jgi:hypothetical protein